MTELTVMTFNVKRNIFKFGRRAWKKRSHRVAQVIQAFRPDIVGTQELTKASLDDLRELLPEYSYVGIGRGGGSKGEYTAIFYRRELFTLLRYETFWLSHTPLRPSRDRTTPFARTCTWCELTHRDAPDRPLRVYNTHLDHLSYFARVYGLGLIAKEIYKRYGESPAPVLLMGDFNASPESKTLKKWVEKYLQDPENHLLDSYNVVSQADPTTIFGRSYHGWKGRADGRPIDYIFTTKDVVLRKLDIVRDKIEGDFPSDHYPVFAQIAY